MKVIKVTKAELNALREAQGYLGNVLEGCSADQTKREGKTVIRELCKTLSALYSLERKAKH